MSAPRIPSLQAVANTSVVFLSLLGCFCQTWTWCSAQLEYPENQNERPSRSQVSPCSHRINSCANPWFFPSYLLLCANASLLGHVWENSWHWISSIFPCTSSPVMLVRRVVAQWKLLLPLGLLNSVEDAAFPLRPSWSIKFQMIILTNSRG